MFVRLIYRKKSFLCILLSFLIASTSPCYSRDNRPDMQEPSRGSSRQFFSLPKLLVCAGSLAVCSNLVPLCIKSVRSALGYGSHVPLPDTRPPAGLCSHGLERVMNQFSGVLNQPDFESWSEKAKTLSNDFSVEILVKHYELIDDDNNIEYRDLKISGGNEVESHRAKLSSCSSSSDSSTAASCVKEVWSTKTYYFPWPLPVSYSGGRVIEDLEVIGRMKSSFKGKKFHVEIKATSWNGFGEKCFIKSSSPVPYRLK
ncbi:hypothetical protein [Candidatus Finniella inopinata]|uniref:Uncharacterized protein n=1 Tax=Candidatus Finniella inopinata TaxID=1696036 RepID=A0A4Q7DHK0_9PROT|nr:hypothetical protein [Candidatus Finniella inopinata]RZI46233.1 hypothetical protein EQU50_04675 [Candidatus Finniella inopinata]